MRGKNGWPPRITELGLMPALVDAGIAWVVKAPVKAPIRKRYVVAGSSPPIVTFGLAPETSGDQIP